MKFSSFFFHLLFFGLIFQLSNTIVSSTKVEISAQNVPTDKLDNLSEQIPSFDSFARTFNKSYPTDVDRMDNMKYYLVRALQTLRYQKHNSTSNLTNNEMSDLSPAEVKQLYMSRDTHEKVKPAAIEFADIDDDDVDDEEVEDEKDVDIGKRLVQQRIKRDTDDDTDDENIADDLVYIDHRDSGCIDEPRSQGDCGACYAFATISFYEWLHCKRTGRFRAFSEQYIIDCGHRHDNNGCDGGNPVTAMRFVDDCGLILREHYAYTGEQGDCPYRDSTPYANMGSLRIDEDSMTYIPLDRLGEHLEYGPIIVAIEISDEYSEGVDDNEGDNTEILHSMLLIAHGRENGKDYWLFRDSDFASGGDGIYKVNKNVDCFRGDFGIGLGRHI